MQRYKKISAVNWLTAETVANAERVSDAASILEGARQIGAYEFREMPELVRDFGEISIVEITAEALPNGAVVNRAVITCARGKYRARVWGTGKQAVAPAILDADEIAALKFGICFSDGEPVTETKARGLSVQEIPVLYADITELSLQ